YAVLNCVERSSIAASRSSCTGTWATALSCMGRSSLGCLRAQPAQRQCDDGVVQPIDRNGLVLRPPGEELGRHPDERLRRQGRGHGAEDATLHTVADGGLDVEREQRLRAPDDVVPRCGRAEDQLEDLAVLLREAAQGDGGDPGLLDRVVDALARL